MAVCTFSGCVNGKEFTVTFDPDGGERVGGGELVQTVLDASEIVEPELEKKGYVLIGWDEVLSEITTDTTVKAIWEKDKIVVTFIVSGGEKDPNSGEDVQAVLNASDIKAPVYVKKGYDLVWDTDLNKITESCTVRGTWVAKKFNLKFRDENDNAIDGVADMEVTYDQPIGNLVLGKSIGEQKIVGWKIKNTQNILTSGQSWTYSSDKTAVPIMDDLETYVIHYNLDNGSHQGNPTYYREGHAGFTINDPTKVGYNFVGWQEKTVDGDDIDEPVKGLTISAGTSGDKYYTAVWTAKIYTVKLVTDYGTFESGKTTKETTVQLKYGDTVNFTAVLDAPNEFKYWEYSNYKLNNGDVWDIDESVNYTFKAVFKKHYKFVYVLECVVRGQTVKSVLTDQNLAGGFERDENQSLGKLPTYTPTDTDEYSSSYWKFKKGEEYVIVNENTVASPVFFVGLVDDDLDGTIVVTLYAWCRPNWTPAY